MLCSLGKEITRVPLLGEWESCVRHRIMKSMGRRIAGGSIRVFQSFDCFLSCRLLV